MDEDPTDDSAKWVLGTKCLTDIHQPLLPPQVLFGHFCERRTTIWMLEDFVDLCAEFVIEIRLMPITITMRNITRLLLKFKNLRKLCMSCGRSNEIWEPVVEILKCTKQINELIFENLQHRFDTQCPVWDTLIEQGTPLTCIFINTGNLIGCKQFSKLISSLQLRELTLWDVEFENDFEMKDFFASLSTNRTLEILDIDEIYLDDRTAEVASISQLISSPESHIARLHITTVIDPPLLEHLCAALQSNTRLHTLSFAKNVSLGSSQGTNALVNFLMHNSTLTTLLIYDCQMESHALQKIITGLASSKVSKTLQILDMSYNIASKLGDEYWGNLLSCCTSLERLNLACTKIGPQISDSFLEHLRAHPSLKSINLSSNRLGDIGLLKLLPVFAQNTRLQVIHLSGNLISVDGGNAIASAFTNRATKVLSLDRNFLGASAQRIRQLPQIKKIYLDHNDERVIFDGVQEV
eukprot:Phypoly_transcript_07949.p1 GENE.Phypoly_transcript_07949~~Phypoly_transcript_07949.p1  ORF type:complete len:523 (+),score=47.10 Phypoly_transcript_07949:174-1571(+)